MKSASIYGWIGFIIGCLSVFSNIVCTYVLWTVGRNPSTNVYFIRILDADFLALIFGIPLGYFAWFMGRRWLGTMAVALCVVALTLIFIHR
jgi:hypothetical protein